MANRIGDKGERLDLLVRQGGTFGPYTFTMRNPAASDGTPGAPIDLTGCLIRGQIRKTPGATAVAAPITITSAYDATGVYVLIIPDSVTAAIPAGTDENAPESIYTWDLELVDSLGRVIPLYWGVAKVFREVTRA